MSYGDQEADHQACGDARGILDRMIELESYNEVVELLHEIIADQDDLNVKTKQRRKNELRRLLEQ